MENHRLQRKAESLDFNSIINELIQEVEDSERLIDQLKAKIEELESQIQNMQ